MIRFLGSMAMPSTRESIPAQFADEAEAARAWFPNDRGNEFKLTGLVDPDQIDRARARRALQLILCGTLDGQDVCLRERFGVTAIGDGFDP